MPTERRYTLNVKDVAARAVATQDGFVVLAGSTANEATRIRSATYAAERAKLIEAGVLRNATLADGVAAGLLWFQRDHAFANASAAATVVLGYQANGPAVWKGEDGAHAPRAKGATPPAKLLGRRLMLVAKQARKDAGDELEPWIKAIVELASDAVAGRLPPNRSGAHHDEATAAAIPREETRRRDAPRFATACAMRSPDGEAGLAIAMVDAANANEAKGLAAVAALARRPGWALTMVDALDRDEAEARQERLK